LLVTVWKDVSGNVAIWFMNGTQITAAAVAAGVPAVWSIQWTNVD
jgi:hypothetical protein